MTGRRLRLAALFVLVGVAAVAALVARGGGQHPDALNERAIPAAIMQEKLGSGGERSGEEGRSLSEEQYADRALPSDYILSAQQQKAAKSFKAIQNGSAPSKSWQELGPKTPTVPDLVTYTGAATQDSGRVTALAVAPTCVPGNCRLVVGAAGGG